MSRNRRPPVLLCVAGHDPVGGAGILADAQAAAAQGVHALTLITALTVQDSHNVREVAPIAADLLQRQIDLLLDDTPVQAIKIGLIGDLGQVAVIAALLDRCKVPSVLDPVLRAGGGRDLASSALQDAMLHELLPRLSLITPNAAEARRLGQHEDSAEAARRLLALGAANVLVTGGDERSPDVRNSWYSADADVRHWSWPRLPETFHGAGCTLASAIAARLARGEPLTQALELGQRWTQTSLQRAYPVGRGRPIPGRQEPGA